MVACLLNTPTTTAFGNESKAVEVEVGAQLTAADSGAWLDRTVPLMLRKNRIAGGVVVIVKDGRVLTKRGYGYADIAKRTPVDPDLTLFRPGSISKLFTWTAVMQQVERGRIDLDVDINRYLDFKIPSMPGARAITMRDLMTHRAGFEDVEKGLDRDGFLTVRPLGSLLRERLPERVEAPGVEPAYSNYGTALAGYIVERVSGVDFSSYVQRNILDPLGMRHATFVQPMLGALRSHMSMGYSDFDHPPSPFETIDLAPAGALSASGSDMARFMIAFLAPADADRIRVLGPSARAVMLTLRADNGPGMPANLLGFYEAPGSPRRIAKH
jgi:CubicO group peptidase (beta-lactamase class C family)